MAKARTQQNMTRLGSRSRTAVVVGLALAAHSGAFLRAQLPPSEYRQLVRAYQGGARSSAIERLLAVGTESLEQRNADLLRGLELTRPDEKRLWLATMLLHAEAGSRAPTVNGSDLYLDEFQRLTTTLSPKEGRELQSTVHLAVAYRLYADRRIVDALRVITPVAQRFPENLAVQRAYGSLLEIVGWTHGRPAQLERAVDVFERILGADPSDFETRVRLGRVLGLLGIVPRSVDALRAALIEMDAGPRAERARTRSEALRFVALLALGDGLRRSGELARALSIHEQAHGLAPRSQPARVALAMTLRLLGRREQAATVLLDGASRRIRHGQVLLWNDYLMANSDVQNTMWAALWARVK